MKEKIPIKIRIKLWIAYVVILIPVFIIFYRRLAFIMNHGLSYLGRAVILISITYILLVIGVLIMQSRICISVIFLLYATSAVSKIINGGLDFILIAAVSIFTIFLFIGLIGVFQYQGHKEQLQNTT